jgi:hypothetical protein
MSSKVISPIVVGIVSRLWTGQSRVRFSVLMVRDLFLLQNLQTGSGAQQAFYSTPTKNSFRRVMRSVGYGDYSRQSSDEVKSGLSYISALLVSLWCAREQLYVFSLIAYLLSQSVFSSFNIYVRLISHKNKKKCCYNVEKSNGNYIYINCCKNNKFCILSYGILLWFLWRLQ